MISCLKATEYLELKLEDKLNFAARLKLILHLVLCKSCKKYAKQSILIDKALKKNFSSAEDQLVAFIVKQLREKIINKIDERK